MLLLVPKPDPRYAFKVFFARKCCKYYVRWGVGGLKFTSISYEILRLGGGGVNGQKKVLRNIDKVPNQTVFLKNGRFSFFFMNTAESVQKNI